MAARNCQLDIQALKRMNQKIDNDHQTYETVYETEEYDYEEEVDS